MKTKTKKCRKEEKYEGATYIDSDGNNFTGYDAVVAAEEAANNKRAEYNIAQGGGFGPVLDDTKSADVQHKRQEYKDAKAKAKSVKKDGRT